jgi:hypothetical protein
MGVTTNSGFEQGAKALCGGGRYGERGYFFEPTVLKAFCILNCGRFSLVGRKTGHK